MAEVSNNEVSLYLQRNLAAQSLFSILLLYGDDCKYTYYPYYALLWHTAPLTCCSNLLFANGCQSEASLWRSLKREEPE